MVANQQTFMPHEQTKQDKKSFVRRHELKNFFVAVTKYIKMILNHILSDILISFEN
jgi:hypothetical protein